MKKTVITTGLILAGFILLISKPSVNAQTVDKNDDNQKSEQIVVEVKKGDSLSKIATSNETTYKRLFDANSFIEHPDVIHPGEKIRVPESKEILEERMITTKPAKTLKTKPVTPKKITNSTKTSKKSSTQIKPVESSAVNDNIWDQLARCESGGNWSINTGNGYYGGLQFSAATWRSVGGSGLPHQNSREEQITRGKILQARSGWGQWPACTRKLGLR